MQPSRVPTLAKSGSYPRLLLVTVWLSEDAHENGDNVLFIKKKKLVKNWLKAQVNRSCLTGHLGKRDANPSLSLDTNSNSLHI